MMENFLIFVSSACAVGQSTVIKYGSGRVKNMSAPTFTMMISGVTCVLFGILSARGFTFHAPTAVYAVINGLGSIFSTVFGCLALSCGPMAITSTICSYSIIIPCAVGILVWNETVGALRIAGFLLLAVSLYLLCGRGGSAAYSKKWAVYVAITFISNGINSVVQKQHQRIYPGEFCSEFNFFSFLTMFLTLLLLTLYKKEKKPARALPYAIPAGAFMAISNYLTIYLSANVDATVLFPMATISRVLFNCFLSRIIFKDKFSVLQIFGIAVGAASILLIK